MSEFTASFPDSSSKRMAQSCLTASPKLKASEAPVGDCRALCSGSSAVGAHAGDVGLVLNPGDEASGMSKPSAAGFVAGSSSEPAKRLWARRAGGEGGLRASAWLVRRLLELRALGMSHVLDRLLDLRRACGVGTELHWKSQPCKAAFRLILRLLSAAHPHNQQLHPERARQAWVASGSMVPSSPDVAAGQANAQCSQKLALGMLDTPGDGLLSTPTALATACNRDSEGGLSLSQVPVAFTTERSETYEFFGSSLLEKLAFIWPALTLELSVGLRLRASKLSA